MACCIDELATPLRQYLAVDRPTPSGSSDRGYSSASTWESRYEEQDGTFDWYAGYPELKSIFQEFCPPHPEPSPSLLMLGCGNSALSGEMHEAGYKRIVNIDISGSAVQKMKEQFAGLCMEWHVMDATAMSFEDGSFDVELDKGTLDAMMHGGASGEGLASAMTAEVWRTLRPGGLFILVSHNGRRRPVLDGAVASKYGSSSQWEYLELRKCALSPQAMLINIMRSKLNGRPLVEGFRDPALLRDASVETKLALKQMQFLEAFRLFKAKKAQQQRDNSAANPGEISRSATTDRRPVIVEDDSEEDDAPRDSRKQPYCWVYVLKKPCLAV